MSGGRGRGAAEKSPKAEESLNRWGGGGLFKGQSMLFGFTSLKCFSHLAFSVVFIEIEGLSLP